MRRTKRTLKGAFFVAKEVVVMYTKLDTKEEIRFEKMIDNVVDQLEAEYEKNIYWIKRIFYS